MVDPNAPLLKFVQHKLVGPVLIELEARGKNIV